jgi:hypothetical protein
MAPEALTPPWAAASVAAGVRQYCIRMAWFRQSEPWATSAAILGFALTAVYVVVILSEENNSFSETFPWALFMTTGAVLALTSTLVANRAVARGLLLAAATVFGIIGGLAIFSVGLGFLLAAVAAVIGSVRISSNRL